LAAPGRLAAGIKSNSGSTIGANNVTVQNGSINGNFAICVDLEDSEGTVQNLLLETGAIAVNAGSTCLYGRIQNCLIVGGGSSDGIVLNGAAFVVIKNNQIMNEGAGGFSAGANIFIANYIENCTKGLVLGTTDKYQGNVTVRCTTPFTGGIAVGTENN
jgi:hypothetical protein